MYEKKLQKTIIKKIIKHAILALIHKILVLVKNHLNYLKDKYLKLFQQDI